MLWLLPFAVCVAGLLALTVLAHRVRKEVGPTVALVDRFGSEHRVASFRRNGRDAPAALGRLTARALADCDGRIGLDGNASP